MSLPKYPLRAMVIATQRQPSVLGGRQSKADKFPVQGTLAFNHQLVGKALSDCHAYELNAAIAGSTASQDVASLIMRTLIRGIGEVVVNWV